jgi:hypothetical protein
MNLKNYTSEVPPEKSILNIEKWLVQAGATDISKKYQNGGTCTAITFRIMANNGPIFFQLPAKVDACFKVLFSNKTYNTEKIKTAWKIVSDWVEVQLSMIKLNQAEVIEIFLPYVYDPATNETFFQKLKGNNFKQLTN